MAHGGHRAVLISGRCDIATTFYRPSGGIDPFMHESPAFLRLEDAVAWCRAHDYEDADEPRDRIVTRVMIPDLDPTGPNDIEEQVVWRLDARTGLEWDEAELDQSAARHADWIIESYGPDWSRERGLPYPPPALYSRDEA
jgi:hypothetical protein